MPNTTRTTTRRPASKRAPRTPQRRERARYSREYPVTGGHDYLVRSIPEKTFEAVQARAEREGRRSVRVIAIKLLELYAEKGAAVFGGWPADEESGS